MPTNYPGALDTTTNLSTSNADSTSNATVHPGLHNSEDGALIALETKLGIGASTATNGLVLTGSATPGTSAWTAIPVTNNSARTFESFGGALSQSLALQTTAWAAYKTWCTASLGGICAFGPGSYVNLPQLEIPYWGGIQGAGMFTTNLQADTSLANHFIINHLSTNGTSDPNGVGIKLMDFSVDCSKMDIANINTSNNIRTAAGSYDGIKFFTNPQFIPGAAPNGSPNRWPAAKDAHNIFQNVYVMSAPRDGFSDGGWGVSQWINCIGEGNGRRNFAASYDSVLIGCTSSMAGESGFYIGAAPSRLVGCNSFYSGNITAGSGYGFQVSSIGQSSIVLVGCEAQDNKAAGFIVTTCSNGTVILQGCISDSNSTSSAGTYPGLDIWNSSNIIADVACSDRRVNGATTYQTMGVQLRSTSNNNRIRWTNIGENGAVVGTAVHTGSDWTTCKTNDIQPNSYGMRQTPAYAASFTPNPTLGSSIAMTLTGNITVNLPALGTYWPGCQLKFIFTQDATGGRTITWNAGYKTPPATTTTLNTVTTAVFEYDGTNWRLESHRTGDA